MSITEIRIGDKCKSRAVIRQGILGIYEVVSIDRSGLIGVVELGIPEHLQIITHCQLEQLTFD